MYLIDTDVLSEARKAHKADAGVQAFFRQATRDGTLLYLSVITIGELRQGVERIRYRGDRTQAARLEQWLDRVIEQFAEFMLPFDEPIAQVWGCLRVPHAENPIDKQIAATALIYDLTVVTRNEPHYAPTGVRVLNPFK